MILQANKDLRLCSSFSFLCVCMTFAHYKRNVHGYCKQMYKVEAAKREEKKLLASRDIITLTAQIYTTYIYVSEIVLYNFFCTLSCLLFRFLIFLFRFFHRNYFFLVFEIVGRLIIEGTKVHRIQFYTIKRRRGDGFFVCRVVLPVRFCTAEPQQIHTGEKWQTHQTKTIYKWIVHYTNAFLKMIIVNSVN